MLLDFFDKETFIINHKQEISSEVQIREAYQVRQFAKRWIDENKKEFETIACLFSERMQSVGNNTLAIALWKIARSEYRNLMIYYEEGFRAAWFMEEQQRKYTGCHSEKYEQGKVGNLDSAI